MSKPAGRGLITWWATPSSPHDHFTVEELAASERRHRPLRRAATIAVSGRWVLLVLAAVVAGRLAERSGPTSLGGAGFVDVVGSEALWLGAGLSTLALRLPAIAVDSWFEYRFRRSADQDSMSEPEHTPVPVRRFGLTVTALTVLIWVVFVSVGGAGYRLAAATPRWPAMASLAVVAGLVMATAAEHPLRRRLPGAPVPIAATEDDRGRHLARLATRFGLAGVGFQLDEPGPGIDSTDDRAGLVNAHAAGVGRHRRVVVTAGLLSEPPPLRDFVLSHELSHVARRHVLVQTVVSGAVLIAVIQALGVLADAGQPWGVFGLGPLDPVAMPVVVLVSSALAGLAAPFPAWVARHQERTADADAIKVLGPLGPGEAQRLLGYTGADPSPPWWIRPFLHHPTPTERLEFMARHRR